MATRHFFQRYQLLSRTNRQLADANALDEVLEILRQQSRAIAEADGVTVVRRDGDMVTYVGEDAIADLWTGQSFPIRQCISGLAIFDGAPIIIPDIRDDHRVPLHLYLSTFVRSMAMFPLGTPQPVAALGLYWREPRVLGRDVITLMQFLSHGANAAFEAMAMAAERTAAVAPAPTVAVSQAA